MTLYQKLLNIRQSERTVFHMPGHKYGGAGLKARFCQYSESLLDIDTTEIPGTDNLSDPQGILMEAQTYAQTFYGSTATHYLVNGSTGGILTMILAAFNRGDKVLVSREAHRSVHHAIELGGFEPVYVMPRLSEQAVLLGIDLEGIQEAYEAHPNLQGVILTYPSYSGACTSLGPIIDYVKGQRGLVLVDEAHGAHLGLSESLPPSALYYGADLVVQSVHKTLPAMTQTALLHVGQTRVSHERIKHYLSMFQSSSPSYVLMASIDEALHIAVEEGPWRMEALLEHLKQVREISREMGFECLEETQCPEDYSWDLTKVCLGCGAFETLGYTGYDLEAELLQLGIFPEYAVDSHVLLMASIATTEEDLKVLTSGLKSIAKAWREAGPIRPVSQTLQEHKRWPVCELAYRPQEAVTLPSEWVDVTSASGRVAAAYVIPYPPGIPLLMPGERLNEATTQKIHSFLTSGHAVHGIVERRIRVIMETV